MKSLEAKSLVLLRHHLKALRLPTMGAEAEKVAAQAAADNADHLTYLLQLCELELLVTVAIISPARSPLVTG